jgi:hypothetical protein
MQSNKIASRAPVRLISSPSCERAAKPAALPFPGKNRADRYGDADELVKTRERSVADRPSACDWRLGRRPGRRRSSGNPPAPGGLFRRFRAYAWVLRSAIQDDTWS